MSRKNGTMNVFCTSKQRQVQIEFSEFGPLFNPKRKLVSCPAINDPGQGCDRACLDGSRKSLYTPKAVRGVGIMYLNPK